MALVDFGRLTLADATDLTAGASGNTVAPDYFDSPVQKAGDGTVKFHAATKSAYLRTIAGGGAAQFRKAIVSGEIAVEITLRGHAWPTTSGIRLIEIRNSADTAVAGRINLMTTGKIEYTDGGNTQRWVSTGTVPTDTGSSWRVYFGLKKGTTTSDGRVDVYPYLTDGNATSTSETPYTSTSRNTGTTDVAAIRIGFTSGGPGSLLVRNVQWRNTLGQFGPVVAPPVINRISSLSRTFDFSGSSGEAPLTLTATQTSGPATTIVINGLSASFTDSLTRSESIGINFTITDGLGQSATEAVTVAPMASSSRAVKKAGKWY